VFVKQITSEGIFLRHLHRERLGWAGVGMSAGKEQAMAQQFQPWRSENWRLETRRSESGQGSWLSMLIDAMEKVARPECRAVPCDRRVLAAVRAQLARPASAYAAYGSHFGLRN
jgi:hypothetical protein